MEIHPTTPGADLLSTQPLDEGILIILDEKPGGFSDDDVKSPPVANPSALSWKPTSLSCFVPFQDGLGSGLSSAWTIDAFEISNFEEWSKAFCKTAEAAAQLFGSRACHLAASWRPGAGELYSVNLLRKVRMLISRILAAWVRFP
jgi:hypothetical protein